MAMILVKGKVASRRNKGHNPRTKNCAFAQFFAILDDMKLLQQAFGEVKEAIQKVWLHKKNFKIVLPLLFILASIPAIIDTLVIIPTTPTLFIGLSIVSALILIGSSILYLLLTLGITGKVKYFIGEGQGISIKKTLSFAVKKLLPVIVIVIYSLIPLGATVGVSIVFADLIPLWGMVTLISIACIWLLLLNFAMFYYLIENKDIHRSVFSSIVITLRNAPQLIVRLFVSFFYIIVPVSALSVIVDLAGLLIIKHYYALASIEVAAQLVEKGFLPPFGTWVNAIVTIIDEALNVFILFPIALVYVYVVFIALNKKSAPQEPEVQKARAWSTWVYAIVALLSVLVLIKTILL